jgi:hypothetical protein
MLSYGPKAVRFRPKHLPNDAVGNFREFEGHAAQVKARVSEQVTKRFNPRIIVT